MDAEPNYNIVMVREQLFSSSILNQYMNWSIPN